MAWGVPKIGTSVIDATGNFDLVEPAGVAQGDLMVACIAMRGNAVVTAPSGWNAAATQQSSGDTDTTDGIASAAMFYIVRGASAPALTCTRTAGDVAFAKVISYSGPIASPLDTGSSATQGSAGNTPTTATFNTAEANELIVAFVAMGDQYTASAFDAATNPTTASGATDTTTAPTAGTWIERFDANTNTGADTGIAIADAIRSAAGATGTIQCTMSSASGRNVLMAAAFKMAQASIVAVAGSYTFTGNDAALKRGLKLIAGAGSYALTGNDVTTRKGYKLTAAAGSFALTGNDVTFRRTHQLVAGAGSFAFTGNDAAVAKGFRITADAGAFALTGNDVVIRRTHQLAAAAGSFAFTGNDITIRRTHVLSADAGSFAFTGNTASLRRTYRLVSDAGSYAFTGNDATLVHNLVGSYTLVANAGVFTYSGNDVALRHNHRLPADPAAFVYDGNSAGLLRGYKMAADAGAYVWTGLDVVLGDIPDIPGGVTLRDRINGTIALWTSAPNIVMTDQQHGGLSIMDEEN